MKYHLYGLLVLCFVIIAGCDQPDEVYQSPPDDYDTDIGNGFTKVGVDKYFTGDKGFTDESSSGVDTDAPTIEVCTDQQIVSSQLKMVSQPIIPMKGAGGIDMTGGDEWDGLTVDEAQSPDLLCQALYYGDGVAAWGDYYELIVWFDTQSRKVDALMTRPGYKGTLDAGDYVFEVNESIKKGTTVFDKTDGGEFDPRTDVNMREMDRALIRQFRPQINADEVDCVDAGSCYIIMSGTEPVLVFMSVELYVVLEPSQHRISNIQLALKRPFRFSMGETEVEGVTPVMRGTSAAGIPNCEVTYGTKWSHVEQNCLGGDPLAMASIVSYYDQQYATVNMGGALLYFKRPSSPYLPLEPTMEAEDEVAFLSVNAGYEGSFSMPYSEILKIFKTNLDAEIRSETGLLPEEKTGVELLRTPDDPYLPAEVKARYPDRMRPGGMSAAYCEDTAETADGGVHTPTYECVKSVDGKPVVFLINTMRTNVATALGQKALGKHTENSYYVQHFEGAIGQYLNDEQAPLQASQTNYRPNPSRPDLISATFTYKKTDDRYTISMYYGGNDDRLHFVNYQKGTTQGEAVLFADADANGGGAFTFQGLKRSPAIGLGATGTVTVVTPNPEQRRAELNFKIGTLNQTANVAYLEGSSVTGYWVPLQGVQQIFQPADWFSLSGGTIGAGFYLLPSMDNPSEKEVVALVSSSFSGQASWCNQSLSIGDSAEELLHEVVMEGYPCEMIVRRSMNNEFITSLIDMSSQVQLEITDDMVTKVIAWQR